MSTSLPERIQAARLGANPAVICHLPSGWAVMCDMQHLSGYCILLADPVVPSLNDLDRQQLAQFLADMAVIGDALLEVTGAFRINYAILGNSDPFLHAHIVPRFSSEPDQYRRNTPWSYPQAVMDEARFDPERDHGLMLQLAQAIGKRL